jgi:hypothetical protein
MIQVLRVRQIYLLLFSNQQKPQHLIKSINKLKNKVWTSSQKDLVINESDIIILNANSCKAPRKRIDLTVNAYKRFVEEYKGSVSSRNGSQRVILWLHTELSQLSELNLDFNKTLTTGGIYIFSNNTVSNDVLAKIYSVSKISLQTSTGEGWSLTNMEASLYRSLQVVPDFLACKYHFGSERSKHGSERGLLIPVKLTKNKDNTISGLVEVLDVVKKLQEAVELLRNPIELEIILNNACEYSKSYSWSRISKEFREFF